MQIIPCVVRSAYLWLKSAKVEFTTDSGVHNWLRLISNINWTKWSTIHNCNRTEWSPIRSVIIRVINKYRTTAKRESDLLITRMITDWIGRHGVLLPINHKNYNFREKEKEPSYEKRGKFALKHRQRRRKHSKVTGKNTKASARARTRNSNFECDWLI